MTATGSIPNDGIYYILIAVKEGTQKSDTLSSSLSFICFYH